MNTADVYAAPEAEIDDKRDVIAMCQFFPTSQLKLVVLFLVTLGLYNYYWFYKHWKHHAKVMEKPITPALRSFFATFFIFSLFGRVKLAAEKEKIDVGWSYGLIATFFVLLIVFSFFWVLIPDESVNSLLVDLVSYVMTFTMLIPMYLLQGVINRINGDPEGALNKEFSSYNIVFVVVGALFWMLILFGMYVMAVGI